MASNILQRHGDWHKWRWSLIGALLCCCIPYVVRLYASPGDDIALLNITLAGSIVASILGTFLLRSFSGYPGVQGSVYLLPSFMTTFGLVLITFLFSRLYYSRSVFIASFMLNVIWFYITYSRAQRRDMPTIGIIPFGAAEQLQSISRVRWQILHSPDEPTHALSAVATDLRADLPDEWERKLTGFALEGLPVYHSKQLMESLTGQVELEHISENSFGGLSPVSAYMTTKHCLDWLAAAVLLVLLMPLLLLVALAIRLDSPGPAIFRQQRIGYRGQPFMVYKFRSMAVTSADTADGRQNAMTRSQDQRVTRIGKFLRTSRIDELPQILNVLKGEMSWIGPRPEAEVLSRWYEAEIPFYRYRHIVRPGITGWAQVNQGHVAEVDDVRRKLHFDFYYIKHFSPWIDLLIVARTIRTMATGFGAR